MKRAALLLCLAGCSDPWAPGESGTYWLADASELLLTGHHMIPPPDSDRMKLQDTGQLKLTPHQLDIALKRIRGDGRVLETERFLLKAGRSVAVGNPTAFALKFNPVVRPSGAVQITYGFSWTGGTPIGHQDLLGGSEGLLYWRRKGSGRCDVVLVAVNSVQP
jgi:hypothetical protein